MFLIKKECVLGEFKSLTPLEMESFGVVIHPQNQIPPDKNQSRHDLLVFIEEKLLTHLLGGLSPGPLEAQSKMAA